MYDRYQIGRAGDKYTVIDTFYGRVKGPFDTLREAEVELLKVELGDNEPPVN